MLLHVWGCRLYEWMRKFIHQGVVKSPKYGRHQRHMLCKLECEKPVTQSVQGNYIHELEKSVSYPACVSVMCDGNENSYNRDRCGWADCRPWSLQG